MLDAELVPRLEKELEILLSKSLRVQRVLSKIVSEGGVDLKADELSEVQQLDVITQSLSNLKGFLSAFNDKMSDGSEINLSELIDVVKLECMRARLSNETTLDTTSIRAEIF